MAKFILQLPKKLRKDFVCRYWEDPRVTFDSTIAEFACKDCNKPYQFRQPEQEE